MSIGKGKEEVKAEVQSGNDEAKGGWRTAETERDIRRLRRLRRRFGEERRQAMVLLARTILLWYIPAWLFLTDRPPTRRQCREKELTVGTLGQQRP